MGTVHWIWLQQIIGYNSRSIKKVLDRFGSAEGLYEASKSSCGQKLGLSAAATRRLDTVTPDGAQEVLDRCKELGISPIPLNDPRYPDRLRSLADAPAVLYVKGTLPDIDRECCVTVVGPRKPSTYGMKAAFSLSFKLAAAGCLIVSGGAIGVDACAHHGALEANCRTVAVLGAGLNIDYPKQNSALREEIIEKGGALVSEYAPDVTPSPKNFPQRNRILSALSCGTVVIEAALGSGSLVTANLASTQGRDLFVLPGVAGNAMFEGSNKLLKEGAVAVLDPTDILLPYSKLFGNKVSPVPPKNATCSMEDFSRRCANIEPTLPRADRVLTKPSAPPSKDPLLTAGLGDAARKIYLSLDIDPFTADNAVACSGLAPSEVLPALTELEIFGIIAAVPGGRYRFIHMEE